MWVENQRMPQNAGDEPIQVPYFRDIAPRRTVAATCKPMTDFTSEDDLNTFEGYLRYQGIDLKTAEPNVLVLGRRRSRPG
jgi:hypothetical protein